MAKVSSEQQAKDYVKAKSQVLVFTMLEQSNGEDIIIYKPEAVQKYVEHMSFPIRNYNDRNLVVTASEFGESVKVGMNVIAHPYAEDAEDRYGQKWVAIPCFSLSK